MDEQTRNYHEMELNRQRALQAGYVNSGVPTSIEHAMFVAGYRAAGGLMNGEPGRASPGTRSSTITAPATSAPG
jgi:hypothetical protein